MKLYFKKGNQFKERVCTEEQKDQTIKEESLLGFKLDKVYSPKENIKEFSTAWLIEEVRATKEATTQGNEKIALAMLLNDLERYIKHISKNAGNKGKGTSDKKAASSAANGRKGGRPKGSKNKPKPTA